MTPADPRPSLPELREGAHPFRVALTTRFRGVTHREGLLFRGPSGWAEFAPFDDYSDIGASRWLAAAIEQGWGSWPQLVRGVVPVNAIIPDVDSQTAAAMARDAVARGCTTMKVKVAGAPTSQAADVDRVHAVRAALDAAAVGGRIRIDVNTGWSVDDAGTYLPALAEAAGGLEYVEQPCATLEDCAQVRAMRIAPVAIDEGIRLAENLGDSATLRAITDAADVVILKPIPLGGVWQVLALAERLQRPVVVSGSMDTTVGLAAGVAAAAALPELTHACGLGTGALLAEDVCAWTAVPTSGALSPGRPVVDAQLLRQRSIPASDPRHGYWFERLGAAAAALGIYV